jgi:hypothetical protein
MLWLKYLTVATGPRSYLSICSKPAVKWVCKQTGSTDFAESASAFVCDVSRHLKMDSDLSASRMPEPDAETAWRYTKSTSCHNTWSISLSPLPVADHSLAYFDASLEGSLGILHRPWFEQQLAAHLAGLICDPDPTWHALRNVVFATGCRIEMCKSSSFHEAAKQAWGYFENALSVYARLLFFKTSIIGVQVLTLMVSISQNS